jgi:hypothetical protein
MNKLFYRNHPEQHEVKGRQEFKDIFMNATREGDKNQDIWEDVLNHLRSSEPAKSE